MPGVAIGLGVLVGLPAGGLVGDEATATPLGLAVWLWLAAGDDDAATRAACIGRLEAAAALEPTPEPAVGTASGGMLAATTPA